MVADYYLVKREVVNTPELYTMDASGRYHYDGGWNHVGLKALAVSGVIAIGWELSTQLFHILPANNLGWVIGAIAGAVIYMVMMRPRRPRSERSRSRSRSTYQLIASTSSGRRSISTRGSSGCGSAASMSKAAAVPCTASAIGLPGERRQRYAVAGVAADRDDVRRSRWTPASG